MAKTYKRISGTWYPIKKIFKRISGTWSEVKKLYKKVSGAWQVVHSGAAEYTFASSITATTSTGILLSSYLAPASADEFTFTVNNGVTLSGMTGATGGKGRDGGCSIGFDNCTGYGENGQGEDGYAGGVGGSGINFTGFSGKKVTFYNYGVMRGGTGGTGGQGGDCLGQLSSDRGCGGGGGGGGAAFINNGGVTIVMAAGTYIAGGAGATGGQSAVVGGTCCSACG